MVSSRAGDAARRRIPYRPRDPARPSSSAADVAVVGAGAAGLYTALVAAEQRRARGARVELAAGAVGELLGAGRARGRARPRGRAWICTSSRHARRGARRAPTRARPRSSAPRRRTACASSSGAGSRSTARPDGELLLSLEGGHTRRRVVHAGGSATGRHVTARAVRAGDRRTTRIEVHERSVRAAHCGSTTAAAPASSPSRRRSPRAATVLATGGAAALWQRTTNPRGAIGAGLTLAHDAGRRARRPGVHAVPPDRASRSPGELDGFLVTEAVRGEGALLVDATRASGSWTSSRRGTRSRARSHERSCDAGDGDAFLDMRDGRHARASRTSSSALARRGHRSARATWCRWRRPRTT